MSSNAFMLPALPQLPASGLSHAEGRGPAAFRSDQIARPADRDSSFAATLERVSARHRGSNPDATHEGKTGETARRDDIQSPGSQKIGNSRTGAPDETGEGEVTRTSLSQKTESSPRMRQAIDWMVFQLMDLLPANDGNLAVQPLYDTAAGTRLSMLGDWIGHLQLQGQQAQGEPVGIGAFEQMQFSVSPEAIHRFFFEQLAFRLAGTEGNGGQPGSPAAAGNPNGQIESSGGNGNPLLNLLLHLSATGTSGTALDSNAQTGSSGGPNSAVGPEATSINADAIKMAVPSRTAEAGVPDAAKMAFGPLSFLATGDVGSETRAEAQSRQLNAASQPPKIQADLQATAQQAAGPDSVAEGIAAKTQEELLGVKSAVSKGEIAPGDHPGSKGFQIDGENKDSGFLFSQDPSSAHLSRLENAAHSAQTVQRGLMPQAMDQIVQKAVLSFNNGQHEVQIDLKPDFLGHIRMQIVSEGHQVAIKIVAELPFVKDMLENNLHQLKAELQAQGLDIDELEVSVAHDSNSEADTRQTPEVAKVQAVTDGVDGNEGPSEEPGQSQSQGGGTTAQTAVDYFA